MSNFSQVKYQELIIEFFANPLEDRSVSAFIKDINISRDTFYTYMKENRAYIFERADRLRKQYLAELRSKAYKDLNKQMGSNTNALKMALEITGEYTEKVKVEQEFYDTTEKKNKVNGILDKIRKNSQRLEKLEQNKRLNGVSESSQVGPVGPVDAPQQENHEQP